MRAILFWVLIMLCLTVTAQPSDQAVFIKQLRAEKTSEKITIDAILDESVWKSTGCTAFVQQEPVQGVKPTQHSEVWLAYDDEAIYFAGKYYDTSPDSILARLVRRDFIWGDPSDGCVLYLDSYGDKRNGYFFYVSAAGAKADGLIENDSKQPNDLTWDAVWDGVARIDEDGWIIEMKIPFSQLRFKAGDIQNWGVNVERFISRTAETDMLAYTPRNESGFTSRFPQLEGLSGLSSPSRFELLPYATVRAEYIGHNNGDPFNNGQRYVPGAGLDIRAGLGSSLTLNATINPDFGQVEVDPAVVNLTDVESTFEEKRPFFTEGVTIYRFGRGGINNNVNFNWQSPNIFYSRRIGRAPQGSLPDYDYADIPNGTHILGAAKVSGTVANDWRIGTIHALTRREFADIDLAGKRSSVEVEPLSYYGVFRVQRDFNQRRQGIGILSTFTNRLFNNDNMRSLINKDAAVAALDGWTYLDKEGTYVISGWGALSRVSGSKERMISLQRNSGHYFQRPDAGYVNVDSTANSMAGYAGRLMLNKNRGPVVLNAAIGAVSPGFEVNDLGFMAYGDLINAHVLTGYRWNEPTSYYQNTGFNLATFANYNFGGQKTSQGYYVAGYWTLPNLYGANASFSYTPESYNARLTRGGPMTLNPVGRNYSVSFYTDNRLWWVLNASVDAGTGEDETYYTYYAGFEFKVSPTLTLQVGPTYSLDEMHAQWITSYADPSAQSTYGRRYVFARLKQTLLAADIRADWIINPRLSLQVYLQPLIANGKYSEFRALEKPKTYDFMDYGKNGSTLVRAAGEGGEVQYTMDADGQGPAREKTISNPDFNILSLRGSAVLRWEYMPGSTLFIVWTQNRFDLNPNSAIGMGRSMNTLFDVRPDNILMLKVSYWL